MIDDRKLLVEKSKNKHFFIAPGGSIEVGETPKQALVRELKEEFNIDTQENDFRFFGTYYADAAGQEHLRLKEEVFWVDAWRGEITASSEVEQIAWITSNIPADMKVGSTFRDEVVPKLKQLDLID